MFKILGKKGLKLIAIPIEIFNKAGELTKIEFVDSDGNHIIDALWDERDEQTAINRVAFRKWSYEMLKRKGYEVSYP